MSDSSQKFIARNRAPRVQIEYDVEVHGAARSVQLPFVMGVLADLSGRAAGPRPALAERAFVEIDVGNFDDRLRAFHPRAAFRVPDLLGGAGSLDVDLSFESLADFAPDAVARRVEPLRRLLDARTRLKDLLTYMDGKSDAESLMATLLDSPPLLRAVAGPADAVNAADATAATDAAEATTPPPLPHA